MRDQGDRVWSLHQSFLPFPDAWWSEYLQWLLYFTSGILQAHYFNREIQQWKEQVSYIEKGLKNSGQSGTRILTSGLCNAGAVLEFSKWKPIFEVNEVDFGFWSQKGISEQLKVHYLCHFGLLKCPKRMMLTLNITNQTKLKQFPAEDFDESWEGGRTFHSRIANQQTWLAWYKVRRSNTRCRLLMVILLILFCRDYTRPDLPSGPNENPFGADLAGLAALGMKVY